MSGPAKIDPGVDARLRAIEEQQKAAAKKQAQLEAEQANQNARFVKTVDVLQDNNDAILYLQKYLNHFLLETVEQGMMLTTAITKFSGFLKLPPSSSSLNPFLDFAFTAVAVLYPALRLTSLLTKVTKASDVALVIAKASETAPPALAVAVNALPKMHEYADVMKKANDSRMKALTALKDDPSTGAAGALSKFDAAKGPIKELLAAANA
jgi:hypothetical protein